jgi:putative phosphoesterase
MYIAIFSDSHDHMDNIQAAVDLVKQRGITTGIHLGDFCAPRALELLADSGLHWYGVWGNVDGDRLLAWQRIKDKGTFDIGTTDFRELELEGRKLFLTHYPEIARIAALSGEYDAVFHGHDHQANMQTIKTNGGPHSETLLANPGELCGFRYGTPTFGIYDTEQNTLEHLTLP